MGMTQSQSRSLVKSFSIQELEDTAVKSGIKRAYARKNFSVEGLKKTVARHLEYYGTLGSLDK